MTGQDVIRWIQENHAEDLPVMVRRAGSEKKEIVTMEDLQTKISIVEDKNQLQYKKYFVI